MDREPAEPHEQSILEFQMPANVDRWGVLNTIRGIHGVIQVIADPVILTVTVEDYRAAFSVRARTATLGLEEVDKRGKPANSKPRSSIWSRVFGNNRNGGLENKPPKYEPPSRLTPLGG